MKTLRIAQISDLHLHPTRSEWKENARRAVMDAYNQDADLIVFSGDVAEGDRLIDFQRFTRELTIPYHVIPGNHECGNDPLFKSGSCSTLQRGPCSTPQRISAYRAILDPDYWNVRSLSWTLLGINSILLNANWTEEENQLEWLEAQLSRENLNRTILFMHYAPALTDVNEPDSYWAVCHPGREKLFQLLKRYGVQTVFHGHLHYYCAREIDSIEIVCAPSTSFPVVKPEFPKGDSQLGYLIIEASEKGISHKKITL
jgi:3',5'-cyclic AMP phosphodiesterase CpdA